MSFNPSTFLLEIVNFLVLMIVLQRLLYRPLREGIARRHRELEEREREAERSLDAARQRSVEVDEREAALESLRAEVLRRATEEAGEHRARLLEQAREDAEAERARARRLLDSERAASVTWVRDLAAERSTEIAGRLLAELAPEAIDAQLTERLLAEIARQTPALLAELGAEARVEVAAARLPDARVADRLRSELGRALGRPVELSVREEASLLHGLRVRVGHLVLDATLAGQLAMLREHASALFDAAQEGSG